MKGKRKLRLYLYLLSNMRPAWNTVSVGYRKRFDSTDCIQELTILKGKIYNVAGTRELHPFFARQREGAVRRRWGYERALLTQDDDLLEEAAKYHRENVPFSGVIYGHQLRVTIGISRNDIPT